MAPVMKRLLATTAGEKSRVPEGSDGLSMPQS
jgi:hypothetical protein